MPWTTQGSFYGPPPLLANLAMAHPCLLAARFLLSARPPDLLQFVRSMSGRPPRQARLGAQGLSKDDMSTPNPGSQPIGIPNSTPRPWSATDIPSSSALTIEQGRLDMWPVVFDHILQLLGRSYRFVVTRSTEAQKFLASAEITDDAAQETRWMHTYGDLNRERLEHAVYLLIKSAWNYPEAKVHFRKITSQTPRCAHAIWQKLLQEYPLDAPYLKYKLLATEMANVMKTPASQSAFHDFVADQVDTTRNLERFNYTLDEFLAGAQLASFETSTNPVLTMTRHKVLTQIETKGVSLSTKLINATATKLFRRAAHTSSADHDSDGDMALVTKCTNTPCPECKQCPLHCMKDGLWRPKPSKFDNVKSPRRAGARALVSQLDRDTIDEIATLALQSKPVVSSMLDMKQAQSSSPANDDESHKRDELLALAAQWSDVSGDSDIHEDNL